MSDQTPQLPSRAEARPLICKQQVTIVLLREPAIPSGVDLSGDRWGPDNNSPILPLHAPPLRVPAGQQAYLAFAFQANWENAVIVYRVDSTAGFARVMRRGTYTGNNDPNDPLPPGDYFVTGWHKKIGPAGTGHQTDRWFQSIAATRAGAPVDRQEFAFEDDPNHEVSAAYDWNDAWVVAQIR